MVLGIDGISWMMETPPCILGDRGIGHDMEVEPLLLDILI